MRQLTPLIAAVALLVASPVLAQQSQTNQSAAPSASVLTAPPADSMTVTAYYKQNVYDNNNNKIGQIADVLVGKDGKINAFVIGAGGFLGMGKHDVLVPFSAVKMVKEDRAAADNRNAKGDKNRNDRTARAGANDYRLVMDTTKEALKNAPAVKYDRTAMTWVPDDSNRNASGRNDTTTGRKNAR
jgi:sporulation protein YlmC with PRC-barrel domain